MDWRNTPTEGLGISPAQRFMSRQCKTSEKIVCNSSNMCPQMTHAVMQALHETILRGWPDSKSDVPESVQPYFNFRDELSSLCSKELSKWFLQLCARK